MRVLVTGGSGKLGRYVVQELRDDYQIKVFDLKEPRQKVEFIKGDILSLEKVEDSLRDIEAIVHLAAIPHPLADPPEKVMQVNVMGTFNILEAAKRCGIKRVIITSSDSTLGFTFRRREFLPRYLPMDEEHPLMPQDAYGLSKLVNEETCKAYTRAYGMQTICLRPCRILFPDRVEEYKELVDDPEKGEKGLWVYVDARDVGQTFRKSLEIREIEHEVFFITARDIISREKTLTLIKKYYPGIKSISRKIKGHASTITSAKAEKILGYKPRYSWRDILKGDPHENG